MSISAKCRKCGRRYSLKEEHAGRKFRCKECESVVTVPEPKADTEVADDWDADFGGGMDYEDYGDDENYGDDFGSPPPPPRPRKKKKPAAKKKRPKKRSSGSGNGGQAAKIGGAVFSGLVVLGIVIKVISAAGFDFESWQSYTTPDGNITVMMPGKVKNVPVPAHQMAPGGQSVGAERSRYACIIIIEPMPQELKGLTEDQIANALEMASGSLGWTNTRSSTLNGHRCVTFETSKAGIKVSGTAFVHKNKVYTLHYGYKGFNASNAKKFFDSVQFN